MLRSPRALFLGWLLCLLLGPSPRAAAQPSEPEQTAAAARFDAGVQAYKQADYARAAEAFLAADALLPSARALSNALAAARRAGLSLLVARAAERSLARQGVSKADRKTAEEALAETSPKLARLEIVCATPGCALQIDGVPANISGSYVLPGAHRISAESHAALDLNCEAGQLCRGELKPSPVPSPTEAAATMATSSEPNPGTLPPTEKAHRETQPRWKRRLPLAVLISTGGGALVLAALATWSGVEALDAKREYDADDPDSPSWNHVKKLAHRSDYFLAGSIVLAGAAAATAIWWVDWDAYSRSQLAILPEGGATLTTRRRF